jgi:hypothetical protein
MGEARMRLIAVLTVSVALVTATASAGQGHSSKLKGKWTNPVGACTQHIIKVDPANGDVLSCSGTSDWTGSWKGSTTWTLTGDVSLTKGGSGRIKEVFKGRARDGRKGTLTFTERFTIEPTGAIDIKGTIVKGSGGLAGSKGHVRWVGTTKADGSGVGTYSGRWQEGQAKHRKHR